jgi:hypothetical protein
VKPHDNRNGQKQDHDVGDDVEDTVGDPGSAGVDTLGSDIFVPRPLDRDALKDGGEDGAQAPAHDDGHGDKTGDAEALGGEDAQIEEDDGHLVAADGDLVGGLGDVKELQCHAAVRSRELLDVCAVAVPNRPHDGGAHRNVEELVCIISQARSIDVPLLISWACNVPAQW